MKETNESYAAKIAAINADPTLTDGEKQIARLTLLGNSMYAGRFAPKGK